MATKAPFVLPLSSAGTLAATEDRGGKEGGTPAAGIMLLSYAPLSLLSPFLFPSSLLSIHARTHSPPTSVSSSLRRAIEQFLLLPPPLLSSHHLSFFLFPSPSLSCLRKRGGERGLPAMNEKTAGERASKKGGRPLLLFPSPFPPQQQRQDKQQKPLSFFPHVFVWSLTPFHELMPPPPSPPLLFLSLFLGRPLSARAANHLLP